MAVAMCKVSGIPNRDKCGRVDIEEENMWVLSQDICQLANGGSDIWHRSLERTWLEKGILRNSFVVL